MKQVELMSGTTPVSFDPERVEHIEGEREGPSIVRLSDGGLLVVNDGREAVVRAMWRAAAVEPPPVHGLNVESQAVCI